MKYDKKHDLNVMDLVKFVDTTKGLSQVTAKYHDMAQLWERTEELTEYKTDSASDEHDVLMCKCFGMMTQALLSELEPLVDELRKLGSQK